MEAPEPSVPDQPAPRSDEQMAVAFEDGWDSAAISSAELSAIERLLGEDLFKLFNA